MGGCFPNKLGKLNPFTVNKLFLKSNYAPRKLSCPLKRGHVKRKVLFQHYFPGDMLVVGGGKNPKVQDHKSSKHPLFVLSNWWLRATQLAKYAREIGSFSPKNRGETTWFQPPWDLAAQTSTDRFHPGGFRLSIETSVRQTITTAPKAEHQQCSHITRCLVHLLLN